LANINNIINLQAIMPSFTLFTDKNLGGDQSYVTLQANSSVLTLNK